MIAYLRNLFKRKIPLVAIYSNKTMGFYYETLDGKRIIACSYGTYWRIGNEEGHGIANLKRQLKELGYKIQKD